MRTVFRGWRQRIGVRGLEFVSHEGRVPAQFGRGAVGKFLLPYSKRDCELRRGALHHSNLRVVVPDSFYGKKNVLGGELDAVRGLVLEHTSGYRIEIHFHHRPAPASLVKALTRAFNVPMEHRHAEGQLQERAVPQEVRPAEAEGPGHVHAEVEQVRHAEAEGRPEPRPRLSRREAKLEAFREKQRLAGVTA
jgi:hypothetical protein